MEGNPMLIIKLRWHNTEQSRRHTTPR